MTTLELILLATGAFFSGALATITFLAFAPDRWFGEGEKWEEEWWHVESNDGG